LWSIKAASVTAGISRMLSYLIGTVTLAFGLWSFYDAARIARTARVPRNTLSMPRWAKLASHALIRRMLKTRHLLLASVVLGVGVSVLESFCTGQVYLSITRMLALPGNESRATGYLLLYNALFVLPLLAMVILCAAGVGSDTLGGLLKRRLVLLKVLMGMLFVMLAAIVFWFG
jgi:cytochrome c biogenesis protein CcdA